jgi:hypothetical protein
VGQGLLDCGLRIQDGLSVRELVGFSNPQSEIRN